MRSRAPWNKSECLVERPGRLAPWSTARTRAVMPRKALAVPSCLARSARTARTRPPISAQRHPSSPLQKRHEDQSRVVSESGSQKAVYVPGFGPIGCAQWPVATPISPASVECLPIPALSPAPPRRARTQASVKAQVQRRDPSRHWQTGKFRCSSQSVGAVAIAGLPLPVGDDSKPAGGVQWVGTRSCYPMSAQEREQVEIELVLE